MNGAKARPAPLPRSPAETAGGWRIARVRGIELRLDASLVIVFALVVYTLGAEQLRVWHPDWSASLRWGTALAGGLAFFASIAGHEFAHALTAARFGIAVESITLFLFGGQARIAREPDRPAAEFWMALAGPVFSLALGLSCLALAQSGLSARAIDLFASDPQRAFAALTPMATLLFWLGTVNVVLAVFNSIPGFPLDGGRIFRAAVWWFTGDRVRATRWAAATGRAFGAVLIALGLWNVLALHEGGGLWQMLIGWFLYHLAQSSEVQEQVHALLAKVKVRDVMRTHFDRIDGGVSVARFVDDVLLHSAQTFWPVTRDGVVVGAVSLADVRGLDTQVRAATRVEERMVPIADVAMVSPLASAEALFELGDRQALVFEHGAVVGLADAADALRWLALARNTADLDRGRAASS